MHTARNKQKQQDLQGIRGFAILAVLGFHFYPKWFPNGYIGVDQFFVLSGYLMCMLLQRATKDGLTKTQLVLTFYKKRLIRILPLYYLIILLNILLLYWFMEDTNVEINLQSANQAIFFVSNRPKSVQQDYFEMMGIANNLFTHTWSLSVEVQFYFIIPFLYILSGFVCIQRFHVFYYYLIGALSLSFYMLVNKQIAFNSVWARIWQFMIGMITYIYKNQQITRNDDEDIEKLIEENAENEEKQAQIKSSKFDNFSTILIFIIVWMISYPFEIPTILIRVLITMLTGILILLANNNFILTSRALTYIGDISYSWYLIHWPIYCLCKSELSGFNKDGILFFGMSMSLLLAIISYHFYEKWYLKLSTLMNALLICSLFIGNILMINYETISTVATESARSCNNFSTPLENITLDEAAKMNYDWSVHDNANLIVPYCNYNESKPLGYCDYKGLSNKGDYKIVIIGNSWVANHGSMIYEECRHKAHKMMFNSAYGCEPLYPSKNLASCRKSIEKFRNLVKGVQPDYAIIVTRFISIGDKSKNKGKSLDFRGDEIYQKMNETLHQYLPNIKRKLFILQSIPRVAGGKINAIKKTLEKMVDIAKFDDELIVKDADWMMARRRNDQIIKDCKGKCELIDYHDEFYNNKTKTFRFYNENNGLSYFTTVNHLSPYGIEHIRYKWHDLCRSL